ncbi:hypothetical protein [Oxalicibacterium faecigallinarum]|uniref:Uncharacterized protein n=1 Tax=Oxalicibacterium faecigallinarum TaxID=573741 RepID=A0A8J3F107_9BURK|nr:hypothetical protein [Oxalicibacterium faecigallinarum]GGI16474.1 hypothetical protein GCM10008066_04140 [Oxalicibacterium faecigallinarum]
MASWYEMLKEAMVRDGEDFDKRSCTLDEEALKKEFDSVHGDPEGAAFTAWGEKWVYFPLCYDGGEWVGHAPRNVCDISMAHQGGW